METKRCTRCKKEKPLEAFCLRPQSKDGREARCKNCLNEWQREYRKRNPDAYRRSKDTQIAKTYGLSLEAYHKLLEENKGCQICGATFTPGKNRLSIDHDHATGEVRGVLCDNCNRGLGFLGDSPERIMNDWSYLNDRNSRNIQRILREVFPH